jgi:CrcB protein
MPTVLWIGLGGFFGANARYLLQLWAAERWGTGFPYGTLLVNAGGSFLIAFFLTLASGPASISPETRLFVAVGFLGGFTTFSSLSYETFQLGFQGNGWLSLLNLTANLILGLVGVGLGVFLARLLQGGRI